LAHPEAEAIVDKMPGNAFHLGLIALALPQARFIHLQRSPMDTCFSCYIQRFAAVDGLEWSFDMTRLGQYYRACREVMAHWKVVLPGRILDVSYESIIADPEAESRRILEFCGFDWEAGCLEFHSRKRAVLTASVMQVRQPIYRSAIAKWKPYAKHMRPLVEALGDALSEQDRKILRDAGVPAPERRRFRFRK
jgi:hypothetical protein